MKTKADMQGLKSLLKQFPKYHRRSWLSALFSSVFHGMRWKCWQRWCHSYSVFLLWDINISTDMRDKKFLCAAVDREADSQRGAVTVTAQGYGKSRTLSMDMWAAPEKQTEATAPACLQKESSVRKTNCLPMALTRTFHQGTKGNRH